jgi:hypothetical protein
MTPGLGGLNDRQTSLRMKDHLSKKAEADIFDSACSQFDFAGGE